MSLVLFVVLFFSLRGKFSGLALSRRLQRREARAVAVFQQRAFRAAGTAGDANFASEKNQAMRRFDPACFGQDLNQFPLDLFGIGLVRQTQ